MKIKVIKICKFNDVDKGSLFIHNGTLALKTEYRTNGNADAYIVGSGEYFWGGAVNNTDRDNLSVTEIQIKNLINPSK